MKRLLAIVMAAVLIGIVLGGVGYFQGGLFGFRFWSWHQKLTISVETPKGMVTASSVTSAFWDMPPQWFRIGDSGGARGAGALSGEAVVMEIASGRYLFVLLRDYSADTAVQLFAEPPVKTGLPEEYQAVLDRLVNLRAKRELARNQYPLLVTFDDINDPASVKRVDPDNLAASFGPGFSLNAITMTITDEPVTEGKVEGVLGWLVSLRGRLKPSTKKYADQLKIEETLYSIDFQKGK
jgi:hypothetical protein